MEPASPAIDWLARVVTKWWLKRRANWALLLNRRQQAIAALRQMLHVDPRDVYARSVIGNLYAQQGEQAAAINEFRELVAIHPEHADSWFNLGFLHDQRDELNDAERSFRRALELNPALDRAWYGLGLVLIREGTPAGSDRDASAQHKATAL